MAKKVTWVCIVFLLGLGGIAAAHDEGSEAGRFSFGGGAEVAAVPAEEPGEPDGAELHFLLNFKWGGFRTDHSTYIVKVHAAGGVGIHNHHEGEEGEAPGTELHFSELDVKIVPFGRTHEEEDYTLRAEIGEIYIGRNIHVGHGAIVEMHLATLQAEKRWTHGQVTFFAKGLMRLLGFQLIWNDDGDATLDAGGISNIGAPPGLGFELGVQFPIAPDDAAEMKLGWEANGGMSIWGGSSTQVNLRFDTHFNIEIGIKESVFFSLRPGIHGYIFTGAPFRDPVVRVTPAIHAIMDFRF